MASNKFLRDLDKWTEGTPLPANGIGIIYAPDLDKEFSFVPKQLFEGATVLDNRSNNERLDLTKRVKVPNASHPQYYPGDVTLEQLLSRPELLCIGTVITQEFPPLQYQVVYDGRQAPELTVRQYPVAASRFIGAQLALVGSPETANPTWEELQANPPTPSFPFTVGFVIRSYAGGIVQNFFKAKVPGLLPDVTNADGDASWERIARDAAPLPNSITAAQIVALVHPASNVTATVLSGLVLLNYGGAPPADPGPAVTFLSPLDGETYTVGQTITLSATATDPLGVA
ncbi:MAG TPA: Ig-like domain-containing protein, partial [Hymenobacter sp.]